MQNQLKLPFLIFVKSIMKDNLIKDNKTCFKNPTKPTCTDLIVTNRPKGLQDTVVFETGLSDFHKMCVTVMKMYYAKQKPSYSSLS